MNRENLSFNFTGKTVLVTGSTRNLGYEIARRFAISGAEVIIHGHSRESVENAIDSLRAEVPGAGLFPLPFGLGETTEITRAFQLLSRENRMPEILVNNAAHLGLGQNGFLEQSDSFFREVFEVNLFAAFHCSRLVAEHLVEHGKPGSIIHISSLAGQRCIHGRSAYSVSKSALDGLTRAMAVELAPHHINVNAIAPGYIWTERWEDLSEADSLRRKANVPAGAPSYPGEIAAAAMLLASGAAPSLVGSILTVDAGMSAQQLPPDVGA